MGKGRGASLVLLFSLYLGLHNGHIALWDPAKAEPVHTFPYAAELYPGTDREALTKGITIHSQEEMSKLMEDYLS